MSYWWFFLFHQEFSTKLKELNNKNIGGTWYTNDKKTYATAYGELFLDFKFINNTINAKLRAKATAFNPTFLGWTKTQTKFKFKIMVI
ncbi:hypothetical protein [Spiroplasma endosymbiont of Sarcophaga carnaria]|uniref:hypothetical protein n=1 Tax=Spiroplasma endosymbiont of Sarcophaga carnaria TaxID=3066303 RepID=UPI0030CB6A0D